ncbi:MAG: hypothetical protein QJR13_07410, partial [Bacillota bacterium]|nr:hypothetical protein [Bacillota bacterium]
LVGFPLANTDEVRRVAEAEGVDYVLVMNDEERWRFVRDRNGLEVFNDVMQIIYRLQEFDTVIFLGSDFRLDLAYRILGSQHVVGIELGESPIKGDRTVDLAELRRLIRTLKGRKGSESEGEGSGIE